MSKKKGGVPMAQVTFRYIRYGSGSHPLRVSVQK